MKTIEILREEAEKIKKEMFEKNLKMQDMLLRLKKKGIYKMSPKSLERFKDLFEFYQIETENFDEEISKVFLKKYSKLVNEFAKMSNEEFLYHLNYYFVNDVKKIAFETFFKVIGKKINQDEMIF